MTSTDSRYRLSRKVLRVLVLAACFLLPVAVVPSFAGQDGHDSEGGGGQSRASSPASASTSSSSGPSPSSPTGSRSSGYVGSAGAEPADISLARTAVADGQALGLAEI